MLGASSLNFSSTVVIAVAASIVGFAAFWSNPQRAVNRAFFAASLHVALWLICLDQALRGGVNGQFWMRTTSLVGAYIALPIWFIKEAIASEVCSVLSVFIKGAAWVVSCTMLAAITLTEWFVASDQKEGRLSFNLGYYAYMAGLLIVYALLCRQTLRQMRAKNGVRRMELQIILLGGSTAAFVVILLMAMRAVLHMPILVRIQPFIVMVFYTVTVIAITTSRVFNARQILMVAIQKLCLVTIVAVAAYAIDMLLAEMLSGPVALMVTVSFALWLAAMVKESLDRIFEFYPQGNSARHAAYAAAQRERRIDKLEEAFVAVLAGWGHSERAIILSGNRRSVIGGSIELLDTSTELKAIQQLRWATPERLARERPTPERLALQRFLHEKQLGVVVIEEGLALTVVLGVGISASRRPFTYPQVTQLMELASIIEGALERAHFSAKIQHTEQLATVGLLGASLAHEIRNPLVSIKTFVQLLPTHYQDPAFRQKFFRLIGDEVTRIDQLTDQLLDLAAPRAYSAQLLELHPLLSASINLVAARAANREIELLTDFKAEPDRAFTDASAAKQVMLNLCFNAMQAVDEANSKERWVKVSTRNTSVGLEMSISDSGPGISPEIRPKLFQPFQTTKSSGFGLGLAICSDILGNVHASISVDPHEVGVGAVFRVNFPCQPLSS